MGDLATIISEAGSYPADDPISVKCEWDKDETKVLVAGYSDHEIYTQAN